MITWRIELHWVCDHLNYDSDCEKELVLDQLDAKTKKGMFTVAKKEGWVRVGDKCFCPSCFKKYDETKEGGLI